MTDDNVIQLGRKIFEIGKHAPKTKSAPDGPIDDDYADDMRNWHDEDNVDGAALLDELRAILLRYVSLPSEHAAAAVALFIAATHAQPAWEHATRLVIKSPIKRCGKTRLQEVIAETCHRPLRTANCSTAALVRAIGGDEPPTIILDEADSIFRGGKAGRDGVAEDLRGMLNAGHSRGTPYLRWDIKGRCLEESPVFAMAVLGGIGDLPDTIEDRAVVIRMRRRAAGEHVESFRRRSIPALRELRDRLATWLGGRVDELRDAEPEMPVADRAADTWEPLVAVADLAGGDWPRRAREACSALAGGADDDADSAGERLLADLRAIWGDEPAILTADLLGKLHKLDESPWGDYFGKPIGSRGLSKLLRPYGVRSCNVRIGKVQGKGYLREDLADSWQRYTSQASQRPKQPENGLLAAKIAGTDTTTPVRPKSVPTPNQAETARPDADTAEAEAVDATDARDGTGRMRDGCGTDSENGTDTASEQVQHGFWDAGTLGTDTPPKTGHNGAAREAGKHNEAGVPQPASDLANGRYRAGLCRDCGERPYSPGRPRCEQCHRIHEQIMAGYSK